MGEADGSINQYEGEVALAKSGRSALEDIVLHDYVMLDFVEDFVIRREQLLSEPDLRGGANGSATVDALRNSLTVSPKSSP